MLIKRLLLVLGSHSRPILAAGVFVGILLPDLASWLRPLLIPAVIGTLTGALLRLDWVQLWRYAQRPWFALLLSIWQLLLSPLIVWLATYYLGLSAELGLILLLQSAAPPIGSAAVFAMMVGLEGSLAILSSVAAILLLPLTLTPLVGLLLGTTLEVNLTAFFIRVTLLVLLPFALAWLVRKIIGIERLRRNDTLLEGSNVFLLVIFAIAVMDGVSARLLADPVAAGSLLVIACLMAVLLHVTGYLAFRWAGKPAAFSAAICSGNRNMGLMLAVTSGIVGYEFSIYVGLAQIPMYFVPVLMAPLVRSALASQR